MLKSVSLSTLESNRAVLISDIRHILFEWDFD